MVNVGKNFDNMQEITEIYTPNDEYENFLTAHIETDTKKTKSQM